MDHLMQERIRKVKDLLDKGINPYPHISPEKQSAEAVHRQHDGLESETKTTDAASVSGRITGLRRMGKASFVHVQDSTGKMQLYFTKDNLQDAYENLKLCDLGDFINAKGTIFKTKTGELTIDVSEFTMLAKSIRPLPEKYHGLQDPELRYRQRYLDMIMNPEVRIVFEKRATIIKTIRQTLDAKGFTEVETPVLQPIYGGANAKPFVTKHNALNMQLYLRISDELYLKRLIVGGFGAVYEISKDFRNEGIDRTHNPEFTMLEWYETHTDYEHAMNLFEEIWEKACLSVNKTTEISYQGTKLSLKRPWRRAKMTDLVKEHSGLDVLNMPEKELLEHCTKNKIDHKGTSWGMLVQAIFEHYCEDKLVQPTFVIDHPIETTPLCKPVRSGDKRLVERFEPFIMGMEIGNAYTELNDPILQRELLERQAGLRDKGDEEANPMDEDFVRAIEHGMPPTSGVGIGIDRMIMLLTDQLTIKDVIAFPLQRPEEQ
ncbi:MAG: lysine--tRNA ligase [Candidatus Woesearchaeota archaeon]